MKHPAPEWWNNVVAPLGERLKHPLMVIILAFMFVASVLNIGDA